MYPSEIPEAYFRFYVDSGVQPACFLPVLIYIVSKSVCLCISTTAMGFFKITHKPCLCQEQTMPDVLEELWIFENFLTCLKVLSVTEMKP